ncbi:MAG: Gfo/Idh/MocA family oxidoreductase [Candidatus Latescibacteria bacterium]|jgi:predicted dehydrogenase|nr:Gfo/Idh/MocA family oxidoreductase [Candidatus Latescibacterota bacterium]
MADVVRIGIVGCGRISEADHISGYLKAGGSEVTGLCDPLPERIAAVKEQFPELKDAECFEKDTDLFASGLVDAVSICTPNDCHYPQTVAACESGLHVLCEKPMAATLEQTTEMIEAAEAAGVILQINQSMRYNAQYQAVVDLVKEGAIGGPFHVRCIRAGNGTPNKGWSPGADWFVQKKHEGGLLVDIGIHMADLMRMIMGDADKVAGLVDTRLPDIDVSDNVNALYRYKNGGTGVLELSWTLPGGAGFLEVYGTEGRIRMGFSDKGIELWKDGEKKDTATTYPEAAPRDGSQKVFLDAVRGKGSSLTPGEYGRRALALCLAIQESSDTGGFVEVKHFEGEDGI